jgi:hypothetical protein
MKGAVTQQRFANKHIVVVGSGHHAENYKNGFWSA